jgi:hypothetical protein
MRVDSKYLSESQSEIRFYDGQRYALIGMEPYTHLDGNETELLVWRSQCPV